MQDNAPAKIYVCATATTAQVWLENVDNVALDWRQLIVSNSGNDPTDHKAIMDMVETLDNKMYFADAEETTHLPATVTGIERTVFFVCKATDDYPNPVAALVGATAGLPAGSFTYKNLILKGIAPQSLTASEVDAIHTKGGITFVTKAGDNVTSEGKVAGGEYIDIVDSKDYVISNLEYKTQKLLNSQPKIPYDNNGIALLESVAVTVMKDAYNNGIIATGDDGSPAYAVNYASRENTDASDRAERRYIGGQFAFSLAGAIHTVEVVGEITI
jgi:hypothetical protein